MTLARRCCVPGLLFGWLVTSLAAEAPTAQWKRDLGFCRVVTAGHVGKSHQLVLLAATDAGALYVLNPTDGATVWRFAAGDQQMGCPAIADVDVDGANEIVVGSSDAQLYVLNGDDGRVKWRYNVGAIISTAPVVARLSRGTRFPEIVVTTNSGSVHCLRGDGKQAQWERKFARPILASPAVADVNGDRQLDLAVMTDEGEVTLIEGFSGNDLEQFSIVGGRTSSPVAADLNRDGKAEFFVGGTRLESYGQPRGRFGPVWNLVAGGDFISSPALGDLDGDGKLEVVALSREGVVHCVDAATGKAKWSSRVAASSSACSGSPLIADLTGTKQSAVLVATPDGALTALEAAGKTLWKLEVGGYADMTPVLFSTDGGKSLTVIVSEAATRTVRAFRIEGGGLIQWGKLGGDAANTASAANAQAFGNVLRGLDAK